MTNTSSPTLKSIQMLQVTSCSTEIKKMAIPGLKVGQMTWTIWVTWVTTLVGQPKLSQVGLICKLNYMDVTKIFNRSPVL